MTSTHPQDSATFPCKWKFTSGSYCRKYCQALQEQYCTGS